MDREIPAEFTVDQLAGLKEQSGVADEDNPYRNDGDDLPTVAEENGAHADISQHGLTKRIMEKAYDVFLASLDEHERIFFVDQGSKVGTAWLDANPSGQFRRLKDQQLSGALASRLLIASGNNAAQCPHCANPNPLYHSHVCNVDRNTSAVNYRHSYLQVSLSDALKQSGHHVTSGPPISPNAHLFADLKVSPTAGAPGNHDVVLVDVTVKVAMATDTVAARTAARTAT